MKYTPKELKDNVNISQTSPLKEFFLLLGGILGIILVVYIVLGVMVDFIVPRLPPEIEQRLGKFYSKRYENTKKTSAETQLQRILDELTKELPTGPSDYKVHLVRNSKANAFALPGGHIVVFTALTKEAESENEIAFVLAHELGHYAHRDHLRGLGRRLVLLTISTVLLGADNSVTQFLQNSLANVEMKFSQRQERQADLWALNLLNRRYGHIAGATDFLEKMAKEEKRGRLLYFFASHPYPKDRVKALEEKIQQEGYLRKEKVHLSEALKDALGSLPESDRKELEERVRRLLEEDNVALRRDVEEVFLLADIYASEGNDKDAIRLYQEALQVDGWRLEYQLKLARLLNKRGDKIQAAEKAKVVYEYAEDEDTIAEAEKFLSELDGKLIGETKETIPFPINEDVEIVIVPIGEVNKRLLFEVIDELQKKTGIKYSIAENGLELGKIDRAYIKKQQKDIRTRIILKFLRLFPIYKNKPNELESKGQFDASRLLSDIKKNYVIGEESVLKGYLGITEGDIFSEDNNFLFGWARKGYGVMSYHRFTARFNYEPPNRQRLRTRTVKQAISSSFHIFGIPRCTMPTCVRAYPHSLTEHDQKGYELCQRCKAALYVEICRAFYSKGDMEQVTYNAKKALELDENIGRAHYFLGLVYRDKDKVDDAIREFKLEENITPDYHYTYERLGFLFDKKDDLEQAIFYYKKAIEFGSAFGCVYNNLAWDSIIESFEIDKTIDWAQKGVELGPDDHGHLGTLGWAYYKNGKYDEAIETFQKCIEKNIFESTDALGMGSSYLRKDNKEKALEMIRKAFEINKELNEETIFKQEENFIASGLDIKIGDIINKSIKNED